MWRGNWIASWRTGRLVVVTMSFLVFSAGCGLFQRGDEQPKLPAWDDALDLELRSPAFEHNGQIPVRYTCDGENVSPPLEWSIPPGTTASLVLIVDDPDAPRGVSTHWLIYNIPPDERGLSEAIPTTDRLDNGALQGSARSDEFGYRGPCPPEGEEHGYRFTLYALNAEIDLDAGADRTAVIEAIEGKVVGGSQLVGRYQRP
jgi:Raf kinase inhibitor-like YbhB/YbcL family protein